MIIIEFDVLIDACCIMLYGGTSIFSNHVGQSKNSNRATAIIKHVVGYGGAESGATEKP